jgi:hypothetical protein
MPSSLKSLLCCFNPASTEEETSPTAWHTAWHTDEPSTSAPRASGMLAGLAPRSTLTDGELQLGGYLQDRRITGRPVEGADFENIVRANETVMQTRQALAYGRGNMTDDVHDSNGQSSIRTAAGRQARKKISREFDHPVRVAASSLAARAGNCGEHAHVAAFLHAAKLRDGQQVCVVTDSTEDHSWAELRGENADRSHHVVMDPWGKGPAIFADDGSSSSNGHELAVEHSYDRRTGAEAHAQMRRLHRRQGHQLKNDVRRAMNHLGPDFRYQESSIWPATPVVSDEFAQRAVDRMIEEPNPAYLAARPEDGSQAWAAPIPTNERWMAPLRQEIHATETARSLGARDLHEIAQAAARIADVALDLRGYPLPSHPAQFAPEDF